MPKKVLIFSTAYFPFVGGAEIAVKEITDRMDDIQFDMITARMDRKLPKRERIGNINVYRMGFGLAFLDKIILAKWGWLKAMRLDKKNNYDIAWSIMASQASIAASLFKIFSARGGSALGGNKKIKLILTLQEGDEEEHLARYVFNVKFLYKLLIRPWHRLVLKKADKVTAISNYLKDRAIKNGVKAPVEIIPNGVDVKKFFEEDSEEHKRGIKNRIKTDQKNFFEKESKIIITTSRLVKKNAVDDVIKSLRYLPKNCKFIIIGDGFDKEKLEKLVNDLRVSERVWFGRQVDFKQISSYLKISDVFVRPSLSEGLGNSFLEAMAAGISVIATPVGGIPDFLNEDETGWFCKVKDPKSIAEKIKYILDENNKEEVERVKENARKLVREKYNWSLITKKMRNIFEQ